MTKQELLDEVSKMVDDTIKSNPDAIVDGLTSGLGNGPTGTTELAAMIVRSINLTTKFSVQLTLQILEQMGICNLSEYTIKPKLTIVEKEHE